MACLICGRSSDYDLVRDGETAAEVCRPCTEEFLAVDEGDPTCVYCDRNGVYDVRTSGGGFPDEETTADTFATPYESVLCEEHFADLGDEEPAGSPEAADESDVADDGAVDEDGGGTGEASDDGAPETDEDVSAGDDESGGDDESAADAGADTDTDTDRDADADETR